MTAHICNVRCSPPIHCEVLYWKPGNSKDGMRPLRIGTLSPLGRVRVLSIEPACEAKPHPDGWLDYTEKALYTFVVLEPAGDDQDG